MSLGSPLGLHFDSSVSTHVDHPYNVEKLIGWWDFTDNNVVFTGDIEQIDNVYVDSTTNGLSYVVEKMKNQEISGHITLKKGERSKVATIAASIL